MGAGRGDVRSRGLQVRSESGVFWIIRDLGSNALPAVPEAVAVAVHLQDVDVMGEPVQQGSGEPFRTETSVHQSKGRLVVTKMEPRF